MNAVAWYERQVERARRRSAAFNHAWLAYYGFFAAFALSLVAFSVLGFVLAGDPGAAGRATGYLANNLPLLSVESISRSRTTVGVLGVVGLLLTGVGWVDTMRSSQRAMWQLDQQPGNMIVRRLIDFGMLIGLVLLLALSLFVSGGLASMLPSWAGPILSALVNVVMAAALLVAVPRLAVGLRRMTAPVLVVGLGLTLLTTVGQFYVNHTAHNPAYKVVGAAAGLLVFLYLFGQLLLFGAALAATGRGTYRDLAGDPVPSTVD